MRALFGQQNQKTPNKTIPQQPHWIQSANDLLQRKINLERIIRLGNGILASFLCDPAAAFWLGLNYKLSSRPAPRFPNAATSRLSTISTFPSILTFDLSFEAAVTHPLSHPIQYQQCLPRSPPPPLPRRRLSPPHLTMSPTSVCLIPPRNAVALPALHLQCI
jgi:hypothetical protein